MNNRVIPMTGTRGEPLLPDDQMHEPNHGSVVLVQGLFGTAFQRLFTDGLWHATTAAGAGGPGRDWTWMRTQRRLVLVYEAEERPESRRGVVRSAVGAG